MPDANQPSSDMKLDDALRALPLATPSLSVWPELAAQLGPEWKAKTQASIDRRDTRRPVWPAALAAALVLAFVAAFAMRELALPQHSEHVVATVAPSAASSTASTKNDRDTNQPNENTVTTPMTAPAQLAVLQARSQALEHWLHDTRRDGMPLPGQDLAAAAEIEDMIGLVDVQLAAHTRSPAVTLWQRRVALLEDLTALRYSSYRQAQTLAVADPPATVPAAWTH